MAVWTTHIQLFIQLETFWKSNCENTIEKMVTDILFERLPEFKDTLIELRFNIRGKHAKMMYEMGLEDKFMKYYYETRYVIILVIRYLSA